MSYPVKELMNLERLQWTKNVKDSDGWAYCEFKKSELFKLAWRNDEANANRLERDDLILLRQLGYVTHVVKVLDRHAEREDWQGDYNLYRIVEVVWAIGSTNPPPSAKAGLIFGYPEVLAYMGGDVMKLEELPTFQKAWENQGGLLAFQQHVQSNLEHIQIP
jgi:hypothetical protein